jgi:hypothetical protein
LAKGGMGVVYRARDTRLNRDVAIKILPAAFASDSDRAARFTREAQVLAALNHPHIAQIYGVEEAPASRGPSSSERASAKVDFAPVRALVMELVEGESLAARLTRGALVVDDGARDRAPADRRDDEPGEWRSAEPRGAGVQFLRRATARGHPEMNRT